MHGRLKVKTTAEQEEAKRIEREKKLKLYIGGSRKAFQKACMVLTIMENRLADLMVPICNFVSESMRKDEQYDKEALEVSGQLLAANPDFYSLWNIRRETFTHLKTEKEESEIQSMMETELSFLQSCLGVNPKSYGTWHHRCWILLNIPKPDWKRELMLCNKFLDYDERNFHCWDYRRFVVQQSGVSPTEEFDFTTNKISTNFSNFSSWHYRSKLLPTLHPDASNWRGVEESKLLEEFELVQNAFFTDPNDQSAWFYHRWLLGKGEVPLDILAVHASRRLHHVVATMTKPCRPGDDCRLSVQIGGSDVEGEWKSLNGSTYNQIWILSLPADILSMKETIVVNLNLDVGEIKIQQTCQLEAGAEDSYWKQSHEMGKRFTSEFSTSTSAILTQELESIEQLHDLEPDNKWTLLTIVSLMRALSPITYETQTLRYLDKLLQVDPMRTNYYHDIRSKFLVENAIEHMEDNQRVLDLSSLQLTALYHFDHLTHITSLDLSNNHLQRAAGLDQLQCVRILKLDNNKLCSSDGLQHLKNLEELSLKNNCIAKVEDVSALTSCSKLTLLHLEGNPIAAVPDAMETLSQQMTSLKIS